MNEKIKGIIHRPFAPAIGKYNLSEVSIEKINQYIDSILVDKIEVEKKNYGNQLAGEITHEISLTHEFISEVLMEELASMVHNYIKSTIEKEIKTFTIKSAWVVCQYQNEYNPIHWHSGHISGVAYLRLPNNFGDSVKKQNRNGRIAFIHGSKQFLSQSLIEFDPIVGDLYLFPSYLMHSVYPFKSSQERRSISFNAFIDKDIVNKI